MLSQEWWRSSSSTWLHLSLSLDDVFGSETSFLVSFSRRSKRTVCCCITQFSPANSHRGLTLAAAGVSLLSRSCSPELYLYCCCFQTKETDSLESLISSVLVYCSRRLQRFFPRLRLACKVSLHSVFAMCCCWCDTVFDLRFWLQESMSLPSSQNKTTTTETFFDTKGTTFLTVNISRNCSATLLPKSQLQYCSVFSETWERNFPSVCVVCRGKERNFVLFILSSRVYQSSRLGLLTSSSSSFTSSTKHGQGISRIKSQEFKYNVLSSTTTLCITFKWIKTTIISFWRRSSRSDAFFTEELEEEVSSSSSVRGFKLLSNSYCLSL